MYRRYQGRWNRFAQPDPYQGSYSLIDPQSFNRYAYAQNDPVNFIDPRGLDDPTFGLGLPSPPPGTASGTHGSDPNHTPDPHAPDHRYEDMGARDTWAPYWNGPILFDFPVAMPVVGPPENPGLTRLPIVEFSHPRSTETTKQQGDRSKCEKKFERDKKNIIAQYGTVLIIDGVVLVINLVGKPEPDTKILITVVTGLTAIGTIIAGGIAYKAARDDYEDCIKEAEKKE